MQTHPEVTAAAPQQALAPTPKFIKVSYTGILLPADATDWVAVYQPELHLTWMRHGVPGGSRTWSKAKAAAEALDLCGWAGQWLAASILSHASRWRRRWRRWSIPACAAIRSSMSGPQ